ncbi:MAG: hypothetical protein J6X89_05735 [Bacteroidales bacterium]|nr:hypothetical protein [Bacteroidales bacterium]
MKKLLYFALACAFATAPLASCQKEVQDNPNYNKEEGTVKTQFVFNISTANTPMTKMSSTTVQADPASDPFRGMEEVYLLAYQQGTDGNHLYDVSTAEKATAKRNYSLGQLLSTGSISESNSKRVIELALPVGTNTLMFYGKAPKGSLSDAAAGKVTMDIKDDATQTSFTIAPRLTAENQLVWNETARIFATCMTLLSNSALKQYTAGVEGAKQTRDLRYAFYWPVNDPDVDVLDLSSMSDADKAALPADGAAGTGTHASQTFHIGSLLWSDLGEKYAKNIDTDPSNDEELRPLEEILGQAHYELCNIRGTTAQPELRAGYGEAMRYLVSDIYSLAKRVKESTPSFWQGEAACLLANRIMSIILTSFDASSTPLQYREIQTIKSAIASHVDGVVATDFSHVSTLSSFPNNVGLPKGAAILNYDTSTKTWSYRTELPTYGFGGGTTSISKYLYPAELLYYGNSPVRVSNDPHESSHYPATVAAWDADATWASGDLAGATGWTKNGKVMSTTRSVAMQKDINYGTALLKSTVKYAASVLKDNNHAIQAERTGANEEDASIALSDGAPFELTGIIIGGAVQTVGWNYVNKGSTFDYLVYDSEIPNHSIPNNTTGSSDPVYTLVWDNWDSAATPDQSPVYVALEFVNHTKDFWGQANKIRENGTFYLIGKLDPAGMTFPTRTQLNYNLPPYNATTGATIEASRVFIQDFMTTAVFAIGENSLKNAYVTVPDLRSSEISLGLSVDIKWETGLSFDNIILGQ